jgi:hypothetical protein
MAKKSDLEENNMEETTSMEKIKGIDLLHA